MSDALAMRNESNSPRDKTDGTLARVVKLVPGETIFIYTSGYSFIDANDYSLQWIWTVICLLITLGIRYKTMEDPTGDKRQWVGIIISCLSFVIYVYALGGPFQSVPYLWKPSAGKLAALAWPVLAGFFYEGPKTNGNKPPESKSANTT